MRRQTSLPLLLSAFFFSAAPAVMGCSGEGGAGSGGGGGEGGSGAGGPSVCKASIHKVHACLQIDEMAPDGLETPFDVETTGLVTAVRAPQAGDPINGYQYCASPHEPDPEVMIDLEQTDGATLTISFAAPGFSQSSVAEGETLGVRYHREKVLETAASTTRAMLEITRDGALVAAVGANMPVGPTPQGGPDTCLDANEGDCQMHQTMEVTRADGTTVSIAEDESAEVDGLLITNDEYFRVYDNGCNFALPVEYVMSAVAQ